MTLSRTHVKIASVILDVVGQKRYFSVAIIRAAERNGYGTCRAGRGPRDEGAIATTEILDRPASVFPTGFGPLKRVTMYTLVVAAYERVRRVRVAKPLLIPLFVWCFA